MKYSKILKNDWWIFVTFISSIIFTVFGLIIGLTKYGFSKRHGIVVFDDESALVMSIVFLLATVLVIIFHFKRLIRIRQIIKKGTTYSGEILSFEYSKDRGYIHYTYIKDSNNIKTKIAVHKSRQVKELEIGKQMDVLSAVINGKDRSIIKELYL